MLARSAKLASGLAVGLVLRLQAQNFTFYRKNQSFLMNPVQSETVFFHEKPCVVPLGLISTRPKRGR